MFQGQKSLVLMCRELFIQFDLPSHTRQKLLELLQMDDFKAAEILLQPNAEADKKTTLMGLPTEAFGWLTRRAVIGPVCAAREAAQQIDDAVYVANLHDIVKQESLVAENAERSVQYLCTYLSEQVRKIAIKLRARVEYLQQTGVERRSSREISMRITGAGTKFRTQLLEELNTVHVDEDACARLLICILYSYLLPYHRI